MDNEIVLTAEEFIKALRGEDNRFFEVNAESRGCHEDGMVVIQNIRIKETLYLGTNKIDSHSFYWNGPPLDFKYRIRIANATFQHIVFNSVIFHKPIFFRKNVVIEGGFNIQGGEYNYVSFDDVIVKQTLTIGAAKLLSIRFYGGEFSSIYMTHPSIKYFQVYQNARIRQLDINNDKNYGTSGKYDESIYYFDMYLPDDIVVYIDDYKINRLKLRGSLKSSSIIVKDLTTDEFYVDNFFNRGNNTIVLSNIIPHSENAILSFTNSYLGNIVFFDINFKKFYALNIYNTNLTDCIFNNVIWPEHIKISDVKHLNVDYKTELITINERPEQLFAKQRENYRQLKHASSKQGDRAIELIFHSKEMKALRKSDDSLDVNNKIILWLSYLSNNHGVNWVYAALWFFIVGAVFSLTILYASGFDSNNLPLDYVVVLPFGSHNITIYWDWSVYFAILNPTHRVETIVELGYNLSSAALALDFFSRIFIAFLIYQVITAFRKFNK